MARKTNVTWQRMTPCRLSLLMRLTERTSEHQQLAALGAAAAAGLWARGPSPAPALQLSKTDGWALPYSLCSQESLMQSCSRGTSRQGLLPTAPFLGQLFRGEQAMNPRNHHAPSQLMDPRSHLRDCVGNHWVFAGMQTQSCHCTGELLTVTTPPARLPLLLRLEREWHQCPHQDSSIKKQHAKPFFSLPSHLTDPEINWHVLNTGMIYWYLK